MTKVQRKSSSRGNGGSHPKSSGCSTKPRTRASQTITSDVTLTLKPTAIRSKPQLAETYQKNFEYKDAEFSGQQKVGEHRLQQEKSTSEVIPNLESIKFVGDGLGIEPISEDEAKASLGIPTNYVDVDNEWYETYSVEQAACELGVQNFVVERWVGSGRLIGVLKDKKELRIPKAIIREGEIAPYLDRVYDYFENSIDFWQYLVTEVRIANQSIRPIDLHFKKNLELVIDLPYSIMSDFT